MRVAIIGSGIAGLGAAWQLRNHAQVTIFEKAGRIGGHSHTMMVPGENGSAIPVDTGFIVYNQATYPNLIALFAALGVDTIASDMSFCASLDGGRVEYAGDNFPSLIGHWQNLFRLRHWQMIADLVRFLKQGEELSSAPVAMTLKQFLDRHGYSAAFREDHLLPMAGAIWSMPSEQILAFPARSFGEFFRNHGLLELDIAKRPEWRTVLGGSQNYVDRLVKGSGATVITNAQIHHIEVIANGAQIYFADGSTQDFAHIVLAIHADEALALLPEALGEVRNILKSFRYLANETYLHSDIDLMPQRKRLWASWNFMQRSGADKTRIFVSYWMNRLQKLPTLTDIFVSLNPPAPPGQDKTYAHQVYHHPQFDCDAIAAQTQLRTIQGRGRIWLCGSYFGYGFHEDALASGLAVATALGAPRTWTVTDKSPAFENATPL